MNVVDWLLDSDPAIRWQALRYLTDASARTWSKVAREFTELVAVSIGNC